MLWALASLSSTLVARLIAFIEKSTPATFVATAATDNVNSPCPQPMSRTFLPRAFMRTILSSGLLHQLPLSTTPLDEPSSPSSPSSLLQSISSPKSLGPHIRLGSFPTTRQG